MKRGYQENGENTMKKTKTMQVIQDMLTENTGKHMLDSGGAYGRHWEQNQGKDFSKQPEAWYSTRYGGIETCRSVFWYLVNNLTYSEEMDKKWNDFGMSEENIDESWYSLIPLFIESINGKEIMSENTYNHESGLSQVIQYTIFEAETDAELEGWTTQYIMLQIHGGCDVRGGYTKPVVFEMNDEYLPNDAEFVLQCKNGHNWWTDDNYHWYEDGCCGSSKRDLKNMEFLDLDEPENQERINSMSELRKKYIIPKGQYRLDGTMVEHDEYMPPAELIVFHQDGVAFCPYCGEPLEIF